MGQTSSVHAECNARNRSGQRCGNAVRKHHNYCGAHECRIDICKKERREGRNVCGHREYSWIELKPGVSRLTPRNYTDTCRDCANVAVESSRYCYTHKCEDIGCSNPRRSDRNHAQRFCRDRHACTVSVCTKKRIQQWSSYCQAHKCSVGDCGAEARVEGGVCAANQHTPHEFGLAELPTNY